jgi:hypothetical protein
MVDGMMTAHATNEENTTRSKGVSGMSLFGLDLHSWEHLMLVSLGIAGLIAVAVFITTSSVVILQRREATAAKLEAEKAKLETERIKAVVAWRTIEPNIASNLTKILEAKPGSVNLRYTDGDPESLFLAIQFSQVFAKASWKVAPGALKLGNSIVFGLALPDDNSADAKTLREAFTAANIHFLSTLPQANVVSEFNVLTIRGAPTLMVGSRSPPQFP